MSKTQLIENTSRGCHPTLPTAQHEAQPILQWRSGGTINMVQDPSRGTLVPMGAKKARVYKNKYNISNGLNRCMRNGEALILQRSIRYPLAIKP